MSDPTNPTQALVDEAHHKDNLKRFAAIESRLEDGDSAMQQLRADLQENTAATIRIDSSTSDMVEFFQSMKGAFKVLNWIGALARPIGAIVLLCTSLWGAWTLWKTGVPPTPPHK
ncbi:hypothetical protein [Rhodoferax ferrireducens]|uniref:hypothetical protein n=1 Tax=Rhodoferax ferrireducens TaxID=192843 RepID=UPI000E0DA630|nr:hypothetical protein [Rhodoferax ferrireducens]